MSTPQIRIKFVLSVLALAGIAACSSAPALNPRLEAARSDFQTAQSSPQARDMAQAEMRVAAESLNRADAAWKKGDDVAAVDHLAYLAKQHVALAQETGSLKAAQASVASATADTDRLRLAARTNEADTANQAARTAQNSAAVSQAQAATSQRQADVARSQASASQQQAMDARQQAAAARQQAGTAQQESLELQAQIAAMNAKKTPRGLVVTIGDVLFDTGRSEIKAGGARHMNKLVEFLKEYPQRHALVEGFTDSQGGEAANEALSDRRASAVRTALLDLGIAGDRITTKGYGEAYPVAGNDNASGRQLNRRVEIVLSDDSGRIVAR